MNIHFGNNELYLARFRQVSSIPMYFDASHFIEDGRISEVKLDQVFPNMNNLNRLVELLNEKGLLTKSISEIIDVRHIYY